MNLFKRGEGTILQPWIGYPIASALVALALGVRLLILPVEAGLAYLTFYPGIAIAAVICGVGPSLLYIGMSAIVAAYIFLPPHWSFHLASAVPMVAYCGAASAILFVIQLYRRSVAQRSKLLRAHEAQLYSFVRQAPAAMAMFDRDMNYLAASQRWAADYGLDLAELVGRNHYDVFPDMPKQWKEYHQKGFAGESTSCEEELWKQEDGSDLWLRWSVTPWLDGFGHVGGIMILTEDITRRKSVEEHSRKRTEELESLLDAVPTPVFIALDPDCVSITGNRAANELLQIGRGAEASLSAPEDRRPTHFKTIKDGRELSIEELPAQRAARGHPVQNFDFDLVFDSGEVRNMLSFARPLRDSRGKPRGAVLVLVDISGRKAAEQELLHRKVRLDSIIDSAMDAIITVDENQRILIFNAAAEAIFGYSMEQMINAPLNMLIPYRFHEAHGEHIRRFGQSHGPARRMDSNRRVVMGLLHNGEEFPIEASVSQIEEGGASFYTVMLRDVTKQVTNEQALIASQEELRELAVTASRAREQEKRRVARELHDELGQDLTALKMDAKWLRGQLTDDQRAAKEKIDAMQVLLDHTVKSMRRIATSLRPMILDDIGFGAAVEAMGDSFMERYGVACEIKVEESCQQLAEPYATEVYRILQETLNNVAKHAQATKVQVTIREVEGELLLLASDNGKGFSVEATGRPDAFGLPGQRERAYQMGGTISVDSAPGKGTTINLRVPIALAGAVT